MSDSKQNLGDPDIISGIHGLQQQELRHKARWEREGWDNQKNELEEEMGNGGDDIDSTRPK